MTVAGVTVITCILSGYFMFYKKRFSVVTLGDTVKFDGDEYTMCGSNRTVHGAYYTLKSKHRVIVVDSVQRVIQIMESKTGECIETLELDADGECGLIASRDGLFAKSLSRVGSGMHLASSVVVHEFENGHLLVANYKGDRDADNKTSMITQENYVSLGLGAILEWDE